MKKVLIFTVLVLMFLLVASDLPPTLPSSFYGNVYGGSEGRRITVSYNGEVVKSANIFLWNGQPVYSIDLPMDGVKNGTLARFKLGEILVGEAELYSGTNVNLDLTVGYAKVPSAYPEPEPLVGCEGVWMLLWFCEE